jgi:hypothetical protein
MTKIPQPTPFPLRMPEELRASVEGSAKANRRSVNAEIVAILGAAMGGQSGLGAATLETLLKEAADRLGATVQINVTAAAPAGQAKAKITKG